jgi:pimeloyl-ACP methyl ester carboxylesterase
MPDLPLQPLQPLQPHTDLWQHTLNPPAGAPVLMLHGNGEDHRSLLPLAQRLAARHTVHLLDSRNHGQSARHADVGYAAMAGDVIALIDAWQAQMQAQTQAQMQAADTTPAAFALVGFSDGAIIALLVALARPDLLRQLVLMGPNLSPADFTPEARAWIETEWAHTGNPLMRLMLTEPHIALTELRRIQQPTWLIAGEDDACPRAVFEGMAAHLPHARLSVLPSHNHFSYIFGSDELAEPMLDFLAHGV